MQEALGSAFDGHAWSYNEGGPLARGSILRAWLTFTGQILDPYVAYQQINATQRYDYGWLARNIWKRKASSDILTPFCAKVNGNNVNGPNKLGGIFEFSAIFRNAPARWLRARNRIGQGLNQICRAQTASYLSVAFICDIHDTFHTRLSRSWVSDYELASMLGSYIEIRFGFAHNKNSWLNRYTYNG